MELVIGLIGSSLGWCCQLSGGEGVTLALLSVMAVRGLCYLSVRVGVELHTTQQRAWAYASWALSVVALLVVCLGWSLFTQEAGAAAVPVLLLGMMCRIRPAVTGTGEGSLTNSRDKWRQRKDW